MDHPNVGFIGVGWLGRPMAERLLSRGFTLRVFNRTREKAAELEPKGATTVSSPAEAARGADAVVTVLSDDRALEAVCHGPEGLYAGLPPSATHLEMSTISAKTAKRLAAEVEAGGAGFLDAPVLGSGPQAIEGKLIIMVGGRQEVLEGNRPVLEALGNKIVHTGDVGSASQMKLVANEFIASMMLGFAQGMTLAQKAGLRPEMVMDVLDASALRSPFYAGKLDRLRSRDFTPNFPLKWLLKDVRLILEMGSDLGVPLPGIEAARGVCSSAVERGLSELDYSAIIQWFEEQSNQ